MTKRMIQMLAAVIVFVAIVGSVKYFQIQAAMASHGSFQPPPEAVTTVVAAIEPWETKLSSIGTVAAVNGVTVSADLPGIIEQISFQSGSRANKGDVLVRLSTTQERAQLEAAVAQRELARLDLARNEELLATGITPQSIYDRAAAEFKQANARTGEIRAAMDRKTIRAPFAGVLGIRQVNVGQYLEGGAPIVSLQAFQPVFVNFAVPQHELSKLKVGSALSVTSDGFVGVETGKLVAFDSAIDESTRNVQVQALFDNRNGNLRPGMFVEAKRVAGESTPVILLPVSAINYAPFGDSVFVVEDVKGPDGTTYRGVRQQFVKLGGAIGDQVAVVSGIKAGEEIVSSGVFKLRPGAAVEVNNAIQPGNDPASKPADS